MNNVYYATTLINGRQGYELKVLSLGYLNPENIPAKNLVGYTDIAFMQDSDIHTWRALLACKDLSALDTRTRFVSFATRMDEALADIFGLPFVEEEA